MSFLRLFTEKDFDYELRRTLQQWGGNLSAPSGLRRRMLETAALATDAARPGTRRAFRKGTRISGYKDTDHRMSNDVMLYASPLGFAMLSLRA